MLEPRGHADMYGALLTEPEHAGSDAGVLFMHNEGYSTMCGHGVIAVVTIALERGLIVPRSAERRDRARLAGGADPGARQRDVRRRTDARLERAAFVNVPSFVLHAGRAGARCGPEPPRRRGVRRRVLRDRGQRGGWHSDPAVASAGPAPRGHGDQGGRRSRGHGRAPGRIPAHGIYGTIFTGPAGDGADLQECDDLRRCRSGPVSLRYRNVCGDGRTRCEWACSAPIRPSHTRASSARDSEGASLGRLSSAKRRPSSPRSKGEAPR